MPGSKINARNANEASGFGILSLSSMHATSESESGTNDLFDAFGRSPRHYLLKCH